MTSRIPKIAIVGGGISVVSCAYRLLEIARLKQIPLQLTLFESASRLGGVIQTEQRSGFILESGPDTFISQKPWAAELARSLGLADELIGVTESHQQSSMVYRGRLQPIPKGFYLLASPSFRTLCSLPFVSFMGKCRMALEPWIPAAPADQADESVAAFIRRRFGEEALWRVGQPMIGGIYTADPETLSLETTFPRFRDLEKRYGSVVRGLRAERAGKHAASGGEGQASGPRYRLFLSFKQGMQTLTDALARNLKSVSIQTEKKLVSVQRAPVRDLPDGRAPLSAGMEERRPAGNFKTRWQLTFEDQSIIDADAVCLALPVRTAERILRPFAPEAAYEVQGIGAESAVTLNFSFRREDCPRLPPGAGFVIPKIEGYPLVGVTFAHQKFEGRAPRDAVLIRVFAGGFYHREILKLEDTALVPLALETLKRLLGIHAAPRWFKMERYPEAMPQFSVGHKNRVIRLRQALEDYPGLFITGNYLSGVGIPDCIHESGESADRILQFLSHP